jgi:O-succinylbenzoic acid--CoA ligase
VKAVWDTGDAVAPLDPRLPAAARQTVLATLRPSRIVGSDGDQHTLRDGLPVEDGDALVMTTSGSSGDPKGVVLTHDAVMASAVATSTALGVDPARHTWLACLPLAHIGGLSVVTRALLTGTALQVLPGFDADVVEAMGRSGQVTHVSLVATAMRRLDPSVFECVLLGGARPPGELPDNAVVTYGMTETGSGLVYGGVPLDGVEVAIDHFEDAAGDAGEGEILLRGPMLLRCYRDGETGRVLGPDGTHTWFATGDAGSIGADGRLRVSGRVKEVINTGGEKVWPDSVERVLLAHDGVAEVAVWKRADAEWGERVVAWVVPVDQPPSLEELRQWAGATLPPWAAPKELVIVGELPRTPSGKVRRTALT